ncbi:MAG TPA: TlpA disulfide reductase family protein [Candidatus Eisenbacteria bacterium]|nr:TlpA disulfide reductase family protein [Candidatus Eisenbacteria bacterium]
MRATVVVLCVALLTGFGLSAHAAGGAEVPNFELKDIDGNTFKLSDHLGKGPIVIDFWATWCKPCLRAMPHLEALRKKYESQQLLMVAISVDESRTSSKVKSYVKTHGYGFTVPLDPNQDVFRKLGGRAMPHQVIVAPDGSRIAVHTGYRDGDERELERHITEALAAIGQPTGAAVPAAADTAKAGEPK